MPPKKVPILAIPFLFMYLMALALLAGIVNTLACLVCAPYAIITGRQPKWLDKLEEYIGIHNP